MASHDLPNFARFVSPEKPGEPAVFLAARCRRPVWRARAAMSFSGETKSPEWLPYLHSPYLFAGAERAAKWEKRRPSQSRDEAAMQSNNNFRLVFMPLVSGRVSLPPFRFCPSLHCL